MVSVYAHLFGVQMTEDATPAIARTMVQATHRFDDDVAIVVALEFDVATAPAHVRCHREHVHHGLPVLH